MISVEEKRDFMDAFDTALRIFQDTEDEMVVVDTKYYNKPYNALMLVRGTGITGHVLSTIYKIMTMYEKYKLKVKK